MTRPLSLAHDRRGAALAEAAIVLPVLILVFAGLFSLGAMFFNSQVVETAARDGARYLARTDDPVAQEAAARNVVVFGNTAGAGTARVRGLTAANVAVSYRTIANPVTGTGERTYRGADPVRLVRVDVNWQASGGMWAILGQPVITYRAGNEQRVIGD